MKKISMLMALTMLCITSMAYASDALTSERLEQINNKDEEIQKYLGPNININTFDDKERELIVKVGRMYAWLNAISNPANPFPHEEISLYFTPDFIMHMNGVDITNGYPQLASHFEKFRHQDLTTSGGIPFQDVVISKDQKKIAVKYILNKTDKNGTIVKTVRVIAIFTMAEDGRAKLMDEVVVR